MEAAPHDEDCFSNTRELMRDECGEFYGYPHETECDCRKQAALDATREPTDAERETLNKAVRRSGRMLDDDAAKGEE